MRWEVRPNAWFVSNNIVKAVTTNISAQSNSAYLVIDVFFDKVETITVEVKHELLFTMKDGSEVRQHWEHTAQKESWTPERRALHSANRTRTPAKTPGASAW